MNKNRRPSKDAVNTVFYTPPTDATKIRSGYLQKSPPDNCLKMESSWKKRYFVLYKVNEEEYYFKYFKNPNITDKPIGGIDLSEISLLYLNPENHQKWPCVTQTMKCSPSNVLYMRFKERDLFLIADSADVEGWYSDLFDALKNRPQSSLNPEEMTNGHAKIEGQSPTSVNPNQASVPFLTLPAQKQRSNSEPPPKFQNTLERSEMKEFYKRRGSEPLPLPAQYSIPKFVLETNKEEEEPSTMYESMDDLKKTESALQNNENEVAVVNTGSLLRSFTVIYEKLKAEMFPLTSFEKKKDEESDSKRQSVGSCSNSSDPTSDENAEKEIPEQNGDHTPAERDVMVKSADLKKHLVTEEKEGPCVLTWTCEPQNVCIFHEGDQILAINDLLISNVDEFNMLTSKTIKDEVKLTIRRQPGRQPLHSPCCPCSN